MSYMSQNFRFFLVSNLSVLNLRIVCSCCSKPLVLGTSDCDDGSRRTPSNTGPLPATVPTRVHTWPSKAAATRADGGRRTDRQSLWLHATDSPRRAGQARPAGHIWPPDAWPGYGRRGGSDAHATHVSGVMDGACEDSPAPLLLNYASVSFVCKLQCFVTAEKATCCKNTAR